MKHDLRVICEQEEEREMKKRLEQENHKVYTPVQRFYLKYGYDWKERLYQNDKRNYKII